MLESCPYQVTNGCLTPKVCPRGAPERNGPESYRDNVPRRDYVPPGGFADPPSASQPMQNTGEPRDPENDRLGRRDSMDIPPNIRTEGHQSPQDSGEDIVVGAIDSAAPWFLTGWAEGVEVDFMIDTGRQVTILATSVFERMCVFDPQVRSRLRP